MKTLLRAADFEMFPVGWRSLEVRWWSSVLRRFEECESYPLAVQYRRTLAVGDASGRSCRSGRAATEVK